MKAELVKFQSYKKKLQGCCDENNLIFKFNRDRYPMSLTIKPGGGLDGQMSMMEDGESGYMSPDAYLVFVYEDGALIWRTSETFTISDTLFFCWWQYFYRDLMERSSIPKDRLPQEDDPGDDDPLDDGEGADGEDVPDEDPMTA